MYFQCIPMYRDLHNIKQSLSTQYNVILILETLPISILVCKRLPMCVKLFSNIRNHANIFSKCSDLGKGLYCTCMPQSRPKQCSVIIRSDVGYKHIHTITQNFNAELSPSLSIGYDWEYPKGKI